MPSKNGPWRKLTVSERGKLIWKLADLIEARAEEFAQLETLDNGETIDISVPYAPNPEFSGFTLCEPMGVVGQVIPWNFSLLMAT
jgi:phenylacetaldehyde dehydrogenase